ncbi:hypothetical protein [Scytonema sp. NUACC26]|uniref:hypothetical protein n=1 Tax=Scytonema sp. NUACC26 TaxID=3140176 RepID=UPI0038B3CEB7
MRFARKCQQPLSKKRLTANSSSLPLAITHQPKIIIRLRRDRLWRKPPPAYR